MSSIRKRLNEFKRYQKGWFDGAGDKFDSEQLNKLADLFEQGYDSSLPKPLIFASIRNIVTAEWYTIPNCSAVLLKISISDFKCELDIISEHKFYNTYYFQLSEPKDFERLNVKIHSLINGTFAS